VDLRQKEREGWSHGAQSKSHIRDMSEMLIACRFLQDHGIETIHDFSAMLNSTSQSLADMKSAENYETLDKRYLLSTKKESFGYLCFTNEKQFYAENYPGLVMEKGKIDDLILMM